MIALAPPSQSASVQHVAAPSPQVQVPLVVDVSFEKRSETKIFDKSQLCVSVWRARPSPDGFPENVSQALKAECLPQTAWKLVTKGSGMRVELGRFAPGEIAIAAYFDADGDGLLNKNLFGMPLEPYGFTGAPKLLFRAPEYKETTVTLDTTGTPLKITLVR